MRRNLTYKISFLSLAPLLFPLKRFTIDKAAALQIEKEIQEHNLNLR